jgi:hypothetical protein
MVRGFKPSVRNLMCFHELLQASLAVSASEKLRILGPVAGGKVRDIWHRERCKRLLTHVRKPSRYDLCSANFWLDSPAGWTRAGRTLLCP